MKLEKQDDEEIEMLLGEIPRATISLPQRRHHQQQHQQHHHLHNRYVHVLGGHGHDYGPRKTVSGMFDDDTSCKGRACVSPIRGISLWSEGSTSSALSPDRSSPLIRGEIPASKTHYPNRFCFSNDHELLDSPETGKVDGSLIDEFSLSDKFRGIFIRDKIADSVEHNTPLQRGFLFDDRSSVGSNYDNVVLNSWLGDCSNGFSNDYGGFGDSRLPNFTALEEKRRLSSLGLHQYHMGNLSEPCVSSPRLNDPFLYQAKPTDSMSVKWKRTMEHPSDEALSTLKVHTEISHRNCHSQGIQLPIAANAINRTSIADAFFHLQQNVSNSSGDGGEKRSISFPHMPVPNLGIRCQPHYSLPIFDDSASATPDGWAPHPPPSTRGTHSVAAFSCEDSLIIQGKDLILRNDNHKLSREHKRNSSNAVGGGNSSNKDFELVEIGCSPMMHHPSLPSRYNSLQEVEGYIYFIAKDQQGCRFLQQRFDEGTTGEVEMIFNEIIDHVVELMMNSFGNYLIQKLLDVCTEEQRMKVLLVVTAQPGQLVKVSLNTHGTRVVQKMIETLKNKEQVSLTVAALKTGFLDLIKDLNGNHVVQRCLQCLSNEDNKFIFDAAAKHCVDIATHRHGCCVLQRCITYSTGEYRENLVAEISSNGLLLAQDAFGNYVVQYILELKIPVAIRNLISQFEGHYVHLSMQKFSSNVVEKCLVTFGEESRSRIIHELLSTSRFEQLLQDPYANYVIHSALVVSKGPLHASLVEAIRPYAAVLRTSPYCKRIFSRALLKK